MQPMMQRNQNFLNYVINRVPRPYAVLQIPPDNTLNFSQKFGVRGFITLLSEAA